MLKNASGTAFTLDVTREVRLLGPDELQRSFGNWTAGMLNRADVKTVAYETENRVVNRGEPFSKLTGLVSIGVCGMMNAGRRTVMLMPYKAGSASVLGRVATLDYFQQPSFDRLKINSDVILMLADGQFRAKVGIPQARARNVLGSIDLDAGVLTLVQFTMPEDPTQFDYVDGHWGVPQSQPLAGDVAYVYNDGPSEPGRASSGYCEIESTSPAMMLKTGESLVHGQRTIHVKADSKTLSRLAKEVLGIDLERVRQQFY
jgi:hypothetical protein